MPVVHIPPQWRELTAGASAVEVEGSTVGEAVAALEALFPGLSPRVRRGQGLAPGLQVSIGDAMSRRGFLAPVNPDSEIHFLPVIGGG